MTTRPERVGRRHVLHVLGVGLTTGVAGCSSLRGSTDDSSDSNEPPASDATASEANASAVVVELSTTAQPSRLPPIWEGHDITAFQAQLSVEASGQPDQVTLANDRVKLTRESEAWTDDTVTVEPGQLTPGEQTFTATATRGEQQAQATASVSKSIPSAYKLDIVPERNEELRTQISQHSIQENYLEDRGGFTTSDLVFETYHSHEQLSFDKFGIDLVAYEWRHDNDYTSLAEVRTTDVKNFVDSIGRDTGNSDIEAIKNGDEVPSAIYPNGSMAERRGGNFDYEQFSNAETVGEALDWVHPYLFNWHAKITDSGPISTEDALYAPSLEQAIEENTNTGLEVHAWDVETLGHGTGLIYGKNADGSEELRFMETVASPVTSRGGGIQLHPLIEESGYLDPENLGYQEHWHPLRFGWEKDEDTSPLGFENKKRSAVSAFGGMSNSLHAEENPVPGASDTVAPTTEYVVDLTGELRNFNQNNTEFETLYNQSKALVKLVRKQDENHIIYGTTENPQYAVVEDDSLIEEVWEDTSGEYDDFDQQLKQNSATT
ncbi:hypothetical protein [Haloferax denitrificans]|uniref:hypothetical protein n=1 Tax=Haloferax denitrificans TaxID=35745 RepID=UPI0009FC64E0|nr:hypothetical protein [Haloferax denitrificans]